MKTLGIIRKSRASEDLLARLEDSQVGKLQYVALRASKTAVSRARLHQRSITYLKDGWVIRELPNGKKIRIEKIVPNKKKRTPGARFRLT